MQTLGENIYVVQGIGLLAFLIMSFSFQMNVRKHILYMQMLGMSILGTHLFLLAAFTGVAMMAAQMTRNLIFIQRDRWPIAGHKSVFYGTQTLILLAGLSVWENWASLFAIAGSMVATYGFWLNEPRRIRVTILISCIVWLPYAIIFKSYPMLLLQAFIMTSIFIAMWRYDRTPKHSIVLPEVQ